ncbi:MAG: SLC13 family permease [Bacteroidota bacterium]|nr:SLC13 family permease [Bacteroidota bacterium]
MQFFNRDYIKLSKVIAGPILGFVLYFTMLDSTGNALMAKMAGVAGWMAIWWIFEAVSLYFTALLPLSLFPFLGIMDMRDVAPMYTNEIIFLFIGGFLIAFGIEKWNLHKRIAFKILLSVGATPSRILFGIMFASFVLSMWISNIATTMMLLPAVLAVAAQFKSISDSYDSPVVTPFLLGLAYAASIGGTATLIGTAPNLIFMGFYNDAFPDALPISFSRWILFGFPVAVVFFCCTFLVLKYLFFRKNIPVISDINICKQEYQKLGPITFEEKVIISLFSITVLLWFFRADIVIDEFRIKGWSNLFSQPRYITDSAIAMLMASILFLFPSSKKGTIISWTEVQKIPLGIIFLFGGGFALAKGISESGLSDYLANNLTAVNLLHPVLLVILLCTFMTFFTELTSNTASTYLILPIILAVSLSAGSHPLLLMIPVVFSASFAFMLPVATPPNTVIFASEKIKINSMLKAGLILNLIGIIIVTLFMFTIGKSIFDI